MIEFDNEKYIPNRDLESKLNTFNDREIVYTLETFSEFNWYYLVYDYYEFSEDVRKKIASVIEKNPSFNTKYKHASNFKNFNPNLITIDRFHSLPIVIQNVLFEATKGDNEFIKKIIYDLAPPSLNNRTIDDIFSEKYSDDDVRQAIRTIVRQRSGQ